MTMRKRIERLASKAGQREKMTESPLSDKKFISASNTEGGIFTSAKGNHKKHV